MSLEADQEEQILDNYAVASGAESILVESKESKDDKALVCQEDQTALPLLQKVEDQAALQNAKTCAPPTEQKEVQISLPLKRKADFDADKAVQVQPSLNIDASLGVRLCRMNQ